MTKDEKELKAQMVKSLREAANMLQAFRKKIEAQLEEIDAKIAQTEQSLQQLEAQLTAPTVQ